jgi:ribosomal protein S12 methylthiotransferase accessory factor YcaO
VTSGCGAHVFAVRAAIRAVTEAAQSRLTFMSGARDDVFPETFSRPLPDSTRRAFLAAPCLHAPAAPHAGGDPDGLLRHTIGHLEDAGVQSVIVVRLSDEALPFAVVKIFVPDLENPDGERARRFGPRALSKALAS